MKAIGLSKNYGGVTVLRDVDFTLKEGEILALVGENGAGKSTLIKILSGAIQAEPSGQVLIEGRPVELHTPEDADRAGIVTVYQEFNLFPDLSITENLFFSEFRKLGGRSSGASSTVAPNCCYGTWTCGCRSASEFRR